MAPPDSFRALVTQVAPITATTAVVAAVMQALTVQHVANSSGASPFANTHVCLVSTHCGHGFVLNPAVCFFGGSWKPHPSCGSSALLIRAEG